MMGLFVRWGGGGLGVSSCYRGQPKTTLWLPQHKIPMHCVGATRHRLTLLPPAVALLACVSRAHLAQVELQFGSVYEKYRYGCYFWECLILLEAFTLTLLLVMLATQNNAALQVLVAMAVIFVEAVLHVSGWLGGGEMDADT